jgi:SagB-type dehydrogenase family enzyme
MKRIIPLLMAAMMVACGSNQATNTKVTPVEYTDTITLVQPALDEGATINQALALRASSREYSTEPLTLEELSGVMWAAAGINRPESKHLTAPSAMALYPIEVYAFTPKGVYLYDAESHSLARIVEGDHRTLSAAQDFAYTAPLNLVYIADMEHYAGLNLIAEKALFLAGQDAAGYAENVNLYAAGHNLKSITRGSLKSAEVLELLGLDDNHKVVLAQTVGK